MITNIATMLIVNKVAGRFDFEDPFVLQSVRTAYIISSVVVLLVYYYTSRVIQSKNDLTVFQYEKPGSFFNPSETKEKVTQTHKAYDLEQVNAAIKGALQGVAMMAFMHLYMKYTNPLVLQSIMPLKSAFEAPIVQVHIFGKTKSRPFVAQSPFSSPSAENAEAAAIDSASKAKVE